jgi:hypothetical protein
MKTGTVASNLSTTKSRSARSLLTLVALSLSSLAFACSGASGADSSPTEGDDQAVTSSATLSQDLVCAVVKAADDHSDGNGLKGVNESALKGDALSDFKAWQKGMASDYPSHAFELPVPFKGKTYTFLLVSEQNDGGGSVGVYKENGQRVAAMSAGESESTSWSKPADKCPE